jgi:salicylate hydroxylase
VLPLEQGTVVNVNAAVCDESKPLDERVWQGPWIRQVTQETMLADFEGWDDKFVNMLKVHNLSHMLSFMLTDT